MCALSLADNKDDKKTIYFIIVLPTINFDDNLEKMCCIYKMGSLCLFIFAWTKIWSMIYLVDDKDFLKSLKFIEDLLVYIGGNYCVTQKHRGLSLGSDPRWGWKF